MHEEDGKDRQLHEGSTNQHGERNARKKRHRHDERRAREGKKNAKEKKADGLPQGLSRGGPAPCTKHSPQTTMEPQKHLAISHNLNQPLMANLELLRQRHSWFGQPKKPKIPKEPKKAKKQEHLAISHGEVIQLTWSMYMHYRNCNSKMGSPCCTANHTDSARSCELSQVSPYILGYTQPRCWVEWTPKARRQNLPT